MPKLTKEHMKSLQRAREKWAALAKAERALKVLAEMFASVPAEYRAAVVERLRERAAAKPDLLAVVNAIAKVLK